MVIDDRLKGLPMKDVGATSVSQGISDLAMCLARVLCAGCRTIAPLIESGTSTQHTDDVAATLA